MVGKTKPSEAVDGITHLRKIEVPRGGDAMAAAADLGDETLDVVIRRAMLRPMTVRTTSHAFANSELRAFTIGGNPKGRQEDQTGTSVFALGETGLGADMIPDPGSLPWLHEKARTFAAFVSMALTPGMSIKDAARQGATAAYKLGRIEEHIRVKEAEELNAVTGKRRRSQIADFGRRGGAARKNTGFAAVAANYLRQAEGTSPGARPTKLARKVRQLAAADGMVVAQNTVEKTLRKIREGRSKER